nr:MAG: putative RNA-dependent RNA polymerase [Sichuan bunya-like virus 3]
MTDLTFDFDDFDMDPSFDLLSPAEDYLKNVEVEDEEEIIDEFGLDYHMKTRISTDPIIELVSRNPSIIERLKNVEFVDKSPMLTESRTTDSLNFKELYNSYPKKEGDLKVDLYFVGSDLDLIRGDSYGSTQTKMVNDFYIRMSSLDVEFMDDRFDFVRQSLKDFVDNKDVIVCDKKNSFYRDRLSRPREKERILGSECLGSNLEVWKDFKLLLFKEKMSNLDDILLDRFNLDENESFRMLFSLNQRIIEDVFSNLSNTFLLSLLKYFTTISKQLLHVGCEKRKRNTVRIMTGGNPNCITILSHGDTIRNEKSNLKIVNAYIVSGAYAEVIRKMSGSFGKYHYYQLKGDKVLIISNWYTVTPKLLTTYSECLSKVLSVSLYTALNGEPHQYKIRCRNSAFMTLMCGISKNREVVNFLSLSRYISASLLSKYSNIPMLIEEKLPQRISSQFCNYVVHTYLTFLKKPIIELSWNKESLGKKFLNQDDFDFRCFLPYLQFETVRIQDLLTDTYLVNLCSDDLVESNHSFIEFTETLKKYEDLRKDDPNYFFCDQEIINLVSKEVIENVKLVNNLDLSNLRFEDRRLLTCCTPNGVLSDGKRRSLKLYDRILEEISTTSKEVTVKDMMKYHLFEDFRFTMVEKKQRADPREIFKTDLKGIACLKTIESYINYINKYLYTETISMGGDQKYFRTQTETHRILQAERENVLKDESSRIIYSRTSDASKWSTGDNMDSLIACFKPFEKYIDETTYELCEKGLQGIKNRKMVLENKLYQSGQRTKGKSISQSAHLRNAVNRIFGVDDDIYLKSGWPQGFFNKLSTYKHFIASTIAITLFKIKKFEKDGYISGVIDQSCHSDDYTYIVDLDKKDDLELWEKCLYNGRRLCCIRENEKKSSIGLYCREFLSFFVIMGSVFIPHVKYIAGLDKDVPGTSYTDDIYASMARVRECYRIGVSEVWTQFAMQLVNSKIQKTYSIFPKMKNYNPSINNYEKPCEYGGYFLSHPIFLLFFGVKANNFRIYNRHGISDLLKIIPGNYKLREEDNEEIADLRNLESFFLFPKFDIKYGSDVGKIVRDLGLVKTEERFMYHERILNNFLSYDRSKMLLESRLFERSGKRMYGRIPKGLMEVVIHRSSSGVVYSQNDKKFSLMQLYQHIDNTSVIETEENRALIEMALFSHSDILSVLQEMYVSELTVNEELVQSNKNISYLAHINLKNPGNFEVRRINESLALLCTSLSEEIKDNIRNHGFENIEKDVARTKILLYDSFGKESISSLEELDLMMRFFNTKYPSNKFLMVPDVRLKSGIDNMDLFLQEMMTLRVSPYISRVFDWKPVGKVKNWKDKFIYSSNLLKTLQGTNAYDYMCVLKNIMLHYINNGMSKIDELKKLWLELVSTSSFRNSKVIDLVVQHRNETYKSGSRSTRFSKNYYIMSKLKIHDDPEFVSWYEDYDFPMEYMIDTDGSCVVRHGNFTAKVNKDGATLYIKDRNIDSSISKFLWLLQMMKMGEKGEDVFPPYVYSFLGKGSFYAEKRSRIKKDELIITSNGFGFGFEGFHQGDSLMYITIDKGEFKKTGYTKTTVKKFFNRSCYNINYTYFELSDNMIQMKDFIQRLKIVDLDKVDLPELSIRSDLKYKGVLVSELNKIGYFSFENLIRFNESLYMPISKRFCLDVQNSNLIKTSLDKDDLLSLRKIFGEIECSYQGSYDMLKEVSSKDVEVDKFDNETRLDDLQLIDFDEVEIAAGLLSQRKRLIRWSAFERESRPRFKAKLFNHYMFGRTSWRGASSVYYNCHTELENNIRTEKEIKQADLLKLFFIMLTLSKLNVVETTKTYDSEDVVIQNLLNYGGLGRKGKFWADLFRKLNIQTETEYL